MNYMLPNWQGSIKLYQHLKKGFLPQQNIYFRRNDGTYSRTAGYMHFPKAYTTENGFNSVI